MITEGTWKAKGGEWSFGVASTGTEQVGVDITILEGPDTGGHITYYGNFHDNSWQYTVENLRLLGWKGSDLRDLSGIGSTEVYVVIVHEPDNYGEPRARVKYINQQGGVAMSNRMDEGQLASFATRMRGKILAMGQQQAPKPPAPKPPAPPQRAPATHVMPEPEDDKIPF